MELPVPQAIGRYVIDSVVGRGAMGVVYLGRDPGIGRAVAVKVLDLSLAPTERVKQDFLHRFRREAQTAGRLTHPSIVTIYEVGSDPASGQPFIAMEYLTGRRLDEVIAQGPLGAEQTVNILYDLASALDHAHQQGIVHRDVKPSNILITSAGFTKIMDFGIARLEASEITHAGEFLGTPAYMSPEQASGRPADSRSDLFALGIVGYEMLTGVRPFQAESVTGILGQIASHHPDPPSHRRPGIPKSLDRIILRLLEKDPARRFQDGAAAALELARLKPTQVVESPTVDPLATAKRDLPPPPPPLSRAPAWQYALAALLGIGAGALGFIRTPGGGVASAPGSPPARSVPRPPPVSPPAPPDSAPAASVPADSAPGSSAASAARPRSAPVRPPASVPKPPDSAAASLFVTFEKPRAPGRYLLKEGDRTLAVAYFPVGEEKQFKSVTVPVAAGNHILSALFSPDGGGASLTAQASVKVSAGEKRQVRVEQGGLFKRDKLHIR